MLRGMPSPLDDAIETGLAEPIDQSRDAVLRGTAPNPVILIECLPIPPVAVDDERLYPLFPACFHSYENSVENMDLK
jgi:hypothetical protein